MKKKPESVTNNIILNHNKIKITETDIVNKDTKLDINVHRNMLYKRTSYGIYIQSNKNHNNLVCILDNFVYLYLINYALCIGKFILKI